MTLIILGHEHNADLMSNGLFIASDSAITNPYENKILLGGFKKVYSVPIIIYRPELNLAGYFNRYIQHLESKCFIAFAGSTLTAQHTLNAITEHLSKLRIRYNQGDYSIIRHCQDNISDSTRFVFGDVFGSNELNGIEYIDFVLDTIEHSIKISWDSASKYKLSQNDFNAMKTEIAAGVYCPVQDKYRLFTYTMKFHLANAVEPLEPFRIEIIKTEIPANKVAVLGMSEFENKAQEIFNDSIAKKQLPSKNIFDFLNQAIDEVYERGNLSIDRPAFLKLFYRTSGLEIKDIRKS